MLGCRCVQKFILKRTDRWGACKCTGWISRSLQLYQGCKSTIQKFYLPLPPMLTIKFISMQLKVKKVTLSDLEEVRLHITKTSTFGWVLMNGRKQTQDTSKNNDIAGTSLRQKLAILTTVCFNSSPSHETCTADHSGEEGTHLHSIKHVLLIVVYLKICV